MRPVPLACLVLAAVTAASSGASSGSTAAGTTQARMKIAPAALRFGRSLGSPTEGHLVGGMHLDETDAVRVVPADAAGDIRWGLEPLVELIQRTARALRRQFAGAITCVGHLSREGGGEVDRHRSHESGRDADLGFFIRTSNGRQLLPAHFVPFRADGTAVGWPGAYFDDARNWALVAALVGDAEANVTHLFIASPLRARLLAFAERIGADPRLRLRAAEIMQQPHGTLPHDDHFHVRIGCPAWMTGCVENPVQRRLARSPSAARLRLVTRAPSRARHAPVPSPTDRPDPLQPIDGLDPARTAGHASEPPPIPPPPLPPASWAAPVDDVDG